MAAKNCPICGKWYAGHRDDCPFCPVDGLITQRPQHPGPTFHLSPRVFEEYCTEVSKYLGYEDAEVTRLSRDGGYDIESSRMLGQVKFQELPVGVKPLRELLGLALHSKRDPVIFALNGFTQDALSEAEIYGVLLFEIKPMEAKTIARSGPAASLLAGLH